MKRTSVALLALLLAGCGGGGPRTPDWGNYSPQVQARIQDAVDAGDCTALMDEFDNANSFHHLDLMKYLNDEMARLC